MTTRRRFGACMFAALFLGAHAAYSVAEEAGKPDVKAVFDLGEGLEQAQRAIANIRNELAAEPAAKIVVVAHGDGVKFLLEGASDSRGRPFSAMVAALA